MNTIKDVEDAIRKLSPEERVAFRAWYAEFDAAEWDRQIEADVAAGRLDGLVQEARKEHRAGRSRER